MNRIEEDFDTETEIQGVKTMESGVPRERIYQLLDSGRGFSVAINESLTDGDVKTRLLDSVKAGMREAITSLKTVGEPVRIR